MLHILGVNHHEASYFSVGILLYTVYAQHNALLTSAEPFPNPAELGPEDGGYKMVPSQELHSFYYSLPAAY